MSARDRRLARIAEDIEANDVEALAKLRAALHACRDALAPLRFRTTEPIAGWEMADVRAYLAEWCVGADDPDVPDEMAGRAIDLAVLHEHDALHDAQDARR